MSAVLARMHVSCWNTTEIIDEYYRRVENHENTEITETVIFVKCRDFAKMPCFYRFYKTFFRF